MAELTLFSTELLVHRNNLEQKKRLVADAAAELKALVKTAAGAYETYVSQIDYGQVAYGTLAPSVTALQGYLEIAKGMERAHKLFNWRSDYAASIIPEFLYRIARVRLASLGFEPKFSTKDSVVELTYSGSEDKGVQVRKKNQDFCMGFRQLEVVANGETLSFVQPALVCEVKTNIDINKLNGLDFSAERLKRSFPGATYYLVTETIDFSLDDNYASGHLDEVYVLRKQVRSVARRTKGPLLPDVFESLLNDIASVAKTATRVFGHVYERLESGKLISG